MTTTPLAPIIALLRRHGKPLAWLEGAPWLNGTVMLPFTRGMIAEISIGGAIYGDLYLGASDICPAAEGWARRMLETAIDRDNVAMVVRPDRIDLWGIWHQAPCYTWTWSEGDWTYRGDRLVSLAGSAPPTAAARLKAVIEYEIGRAA